MTFLEISQLYSHTLSAPNPLFAVFLTVLSVSEKNTFSHPSQRNALSSGRTSCWRACRSPVASAPPQGQCSDGSALWFCPGSGACCCPLPSWGTGNPWSGWSKSVCLWWSSWAPGSPARGPALQPGRWSGARRSRTGSGPWGSTAASCPGAWRRCRSGWRSTRCRWAP